MTMITGKDSARYFEQASGGGKVNSGQHTTGLDTLGSSLTEAVTSPWDTANGVLTTLSARSFWVRVAFILGGFIIALIATAHLTGSQSLATTAEKVTP